MLKRSSWQTVAVLVLTGFFISSCGKPATVEQAGTTTLPEDRSGVSQPAVSATAPAKVVCPEYYTEKFGGSETQNCWLSTPPLIVTTTKPDQVFLKVVEGGLNLLINATQTDAYVFYDGGVYGDVNIQANITSSGVNNHAAVLLCRANDTGWYEARVSTSGYYSVYRYDTDKHLAHKNPYTDFIVDTVSTAINMGSDKTNVAQFICSGNNLILYINGTEVFNRPLATQTDPGLAGIGGHSMEKTPVNLTFQNILIGKP
jgi:hypothetical protein